MVSRRRLALPIVLMLAFGLSACGSTDDGPVDAAYIDDPADFRAGGVRLSAGAQHLRGATGAGLVSLDERGEVIPALADRWIVTEDGLSFIFRLRDGTWPGGQPLTAESVRTALRRTMVTLRGTSLALDLAPISEIRAMAGRVVEIRLSTPSPMLLQLLAQPELALTRSDGGTASSATGSGPMRQERRGDLMVLTMKPPRDRGEPEAADWQAWVRPVHIRAMPAARAVTAFEDGEVDMVLGGRFPALPLVDTGPLSRGTVRLDPVIGLFGLRVSRASGFLASAENREALALALDRPALVAAFGVAGWTDTTRLVPAAVAGEEPLVAERWTDIAQEDRRATAAARVGAWRAGSGGPPRIVLALGRSPGEDLLFAELRRQFAQVGIELERGQPGRPADLEIVDQPARYAGQLWFLNQFNCSLRRGLCSGTADGLVKQALATQDMAERNRLLAAAEADLTRANVYVPFGSPMRFALVRGTVDGFAPNSWAYHPLPALAVIPR